MIADQNLTVTRTAAGAWGSGEYVAGSDSTFTARGSVQPITGQQLEYLPEGARSRAQHVFYAMPDATALRTAQAGSELSADRVAYDGETWVIFECQNWTGHTGGARHRAYVLVMAGGDDA